MSINYRRPEYVKLKKTWKLVRDVLGGPMAIADAKTLYLPMPNAEDTSDANKKRYDAYLQRAVFYEATSRTLQGLIGQIFYRDPVIELPSLLESLNESVDGGEMRLEQQARMACGEGLSVGHGALYVDYPTTEGTTTLAQIRSGQVRPTILLYKAEQIINWRYTLIGSRRVLNLLVIEESYDSNDDGYEIESDTQWRVLRVLTEDDEGNPVDPFCRIEIHRETPKGLEIVEQYEPRMGNGQLWPYIPVAFFGAEDNEPFPDKAPLEGMAKVNIAHYRNSADYEESCFMVGQPTPWGSGIDQDWIDEVWKGTITLGSRAFIPFPAGGQAGLLQAAPNTMVKEAMEGKERQMVALGAKLVEQQQVQRTATEAGQENIVENSILSNVAKNVTMAYQKAILMCMEYINISDKFEFELNTDFEIYRLSPQDRQQLLTEWQGGGITWEEYRFNIKRAGVAYEEDAAAKRKIESEMEEDLDLDGGDDDDKSGEDGSSDEETGSTEEED